MIAPRYQNVNANEIAEIKREGGAKIRVIAGKVDGVVGPISGIAAEPTYLDVVIAPHGSFSLPIPRGHSAFAYIFEGEGRFGPEDRTSRRRDSWFGTTAIESNASGRGAVRFLLVSGKPLDEPIARYGPFVMNTKAEIEQTLRELQSGTFAQ